MLLHCDALGEVARLVHVEALVPGDVVCEQLQGHTTDEGCNYLRRLGDREYQAGDAFRGPISFAGDDDHVRPPGDCLLDVGEGFLPNQTFSEDGYDRTVLVYERYGAVLHLARRVTLGGQVGDLLELQSPLQRH